MRGPRSLAHGICLLVVSLFFFPSPAVAAPPTITISEDAVRVAGVTAGGQAVVWSVAHEGRGYDYEVLRQVRSATDDDRDGVVTFDRGLARSFHSIFVVADVASGEVSIATPSGFQQKLELEETPIKPGKLALRTEDVDVLLVRRNGAWRGFAAEGTARDHDGARDGIVSIALAQFEPVGKNGGPAPQAFVPGDVLVLIEPLTMRFTKLTVTPGAGVR